MKTLFISLFLLFSLSIPLLAQQIKATLSGHTSTEAFSVLDDNLSYLLSVRGNGNVGIGTTSPQYKIDVVGSDARINGIILGTGPGDILREYNTVAGGNAFINNVSGNSNVAIGREALFSNTTANSNTAIGFESLYNTTSGAANTACGNGTLLNNVTGGNNSAFGTFSLLGNTSGVGNTAIGYRSGEFGATISNGTFIGSESYATQNGLTNVSGLGYDSHPSASNQVRIGNTSVTSIGGYANWTTLSDERYKLNVQENVKGLDFIMKLRPVTFQLNMNKLVADLKEDQRVDSNGNIINSSAEIDINSRNEKSQIIYTGFIAQEVQQVSKELAYDFSGIDAPKNDNDFYGLRYAEFVVPLVKAVQEQQKIIDDLTRRIDGVYYTGKTDEFPQIVFFDEKQIGVMVQEIEKIYSEIVKINKAGYKTVDYTKLTTVLIDAVKERQQIIEKQDKVIKDMNQRLEKIEKMIGNKKIASR